MELHYSNIDEVFDIALYEHDEEAKFLHEDELMSSINSTELNLVNYIKVDFDEKFYLDSYHDVRESGIKSLTHFLIHGYAEGRVWSYHHLISLKNAVAQLVETNPQIFAPSFLDSSEKSQEKYLLKADRGEYILNHEALEFLQKYYVISMSRGSKCFCNFLLFGKNEILVEDEFNNSQVNTVLNSRHFSVSFYAKQHPCIEKYTPIDLVRHYFCEGETFFLSTSKTFTTYAYVLSYPDLTNLSINKLHHFIVHGEIEGRLACGQHVQRNGKVVFSETKPSILISAHEASRTGAPIVSLELCKAYSATHNVVLWLGKDGPLLSSFIDNTSLIHIEKLQTDLISESFSMLASEFKFECAIVNSAECYPIAYETLKFDIKTISLVHEFSEYARPRGRIASLACMSDTIIVPAEIIKKSLLNDIRYLGITPEKINIVVKNQGVSDIELVENNEDKLILNDLINKKVKLGKKKLVLGCGWVQPRKGVTKFLEVARNVRKHTSDVLFIWVGGNYRPESDMTYSAYLGDFVNRCEMNSDVLFINQVDNLEPFWELADMFFMSSLLDPFPNVAIDAIVRNIPVLCFEGCTGIAELQEKLPDHVYVADYLNSEHAGSLALSILASDKMTVDKKILNELFSYEEYRKIIDNEVQKINPNLSIVAPIKMPRWFLQKINIKYIHEQKEKQNAINKFVSKFNDTGKLSNTIELEVDHSFSATLKSNEYFVLVKAHLEETSVDTLFGVLKELRCELPNSKLFVLSNSLSRNYKTIVKSENLFCYQTLLCDSNSEAKVRLMSEHQRRNYSFVNIVFDNDTSPEVIKELKQVHSDCMGNKKNVSESFFGVDGLKFWDNIEQEYYCPLISMEMLS